MSYGIVDIVLNGSKLYGCGCGMHTNGDIDDNRSASESKLNVEQGIH